MSETMVIAIVVGVILVIAIAVISRRLTGVSVKAGPLSGTLKGQQPGSSASDNELKGQRQEIDVSGSDSHADRNKTDGSDIKINVKS